MIKYKFRKEELSKETCPWEFGEFEMPEAEKVHY